MHPICRQNLFLVKEHVGFFKAANNYDILDPGSGQVMLHCREDKLGVFTKILRFTKYKRMTPFDLAVRTPDGQPVLRVHRGTSVFLSRVAVRDENDQVLGGFKQRLFSIGGAFDVFDAGERPVCQLKGKWTGWEFRFVAGEREVAQITKKWSGIGKELFTSADTYMLKIADDVPADHSIRMLVLGAVLCIDMVLSE